MRADRDRLLEARYLVSPHADGAGMRFAAPALRADLDRLASTLRGPMATIVRPVATRDPSLELVAILESLAGDGSPIATRHGVWFSADGRRAILLARLAAGAAALDSQANAIDALRTAFAPLEQPGINLRIGGTPALALRSRESIQGDAMRLSLAALVAIIAILFAVLRSGRFLAAAALPIASGVLAGVAATATLFGSVHGVTLGFGITLIGEAVDYSIYTHLHRHPDGRYPRRFWPLMWLAAASSAAGFAAMCLSGFRGLEQLGVFSVVGILAAGASTRWLLPACLPQRPPPAPRWLDWGLTALQVGLRRLRPLLIVATLAAIALLGWRGATVWDDDLASISPLSPAVLGDEARLRADLGLPDAGLLVVVEAPDLQQALARAETIGTSLAGLRAQGLIAGFDDPTRLLPSAARQRARQQRLPAPKTLASDLDVALRGSVFRPGTFDPFLADVERARTREPIGPAFYRGTMIGHRLDAQIAASGSGGVRLTIPLAGVRDLASTRAALAGGAGVHVLDLKSDVEAIVRDYRRRASWVALAGALAITLLIAWRAGSARAAARVLAILPGTVALTAAAQVLIYNRLTLFNLVALLLVVGIASNYALFFAARHQGDAGNSAARMSVGLCAMTTFVAFLLLSLSSTPVLRMIGSTVAMGAALGLALSMAFAARAEANA
ncbi:MAG: MMPL family transporter [Burkholderiaceae bacterium]